MEALTIKVFTLGCKVNQCESASLVAALKAASYNASEGLEPADVYILNTCSVTAEADKKSRQCIARMRRLNSDCKIIVIGCSSQNSPDKFDKPNVYAVGGTSNKTDFVLKTIENICNNTISDRILYDNRIENIDKLREYCYEPYPETNKTRAFVKIQDGCNRFCTYCIIPYLRGRSRSRKIDDIVKECKQIKSKEIVLTGIDMSSYGKDIGEDFTGLLNALGDISARKRLGSVECEVIDERVLDAMVKGNYCPHFHLSLQSGSEAVLRSMNRHYDCEYFYGKIRLIREYFPLAGITTDVIVGFPTESDENFAESCDFIEKCFFSDIHVFPYSSREGTIAAKKYSPLDAEIVKKRVSALRDIKSKLHSSFIENNIGLTAPVYIEDFENGFNVGYTPNYIKVYSDSECGSIVDLKLKARFKDGVLGVL